MVFFGVFFLMGLFGGAFFGGAFFVGLLVMFFLVELFGEMTPHHRLRMPLVNRSHIREGIR